MIFRVLVVDDHEAWRRYVSTALGRNLRLQVIGEVADGLEAVQTAARLKPDLTVLDVGLPTLNGIEVARRILTLAPDSKILFLSEHGSRDIVEVALRTGAHGYVFKSDAGAELLTAIEAIIEGKPFIGARFAPQVFERTTASERGLQRARCHEVQFCSDEASLLDGFARFAEDALKSGCAAIVVAGSSLRNTLHHRLQSCGLDIDAALGEGRYVSLDVADTLSTFMVNGRLDEARFWKAATDLVLEASRASNGAHRRVAACGECAPTLWREGHAAAAVRLEQLWDELSRRHGVDIWCGYSLSAPLRDDEYKVFQQICSEHSAVHWG
jgi:DNA-binding NarL/FixJ family response regulator